MLKTLLSKTLLLLVVMIAGVSTAWAADKTITLDYNSFGLTTSYAEKTATVDGFGFTVNQGYKGSGNTIQMNSSKGSGILYNTTAISGLKSITVNVSSGSKTYTVTTGTSEKPTANSQTGTSTGTYNAASGDTYFQLKVSGASYFSSIVITYEDNSGSSSNLEDNDLALTGAPIALNFDLYNNSAAQTVNFTTSSTGVVTVSGGEGFVTTSLSGTAITVTPVAVTPSPQTITVSQAADETYDAGSVTFTVSVDDSTPFNGGDVTFDATTDKGSSPLTKNVVTFTCDNGVLNNGSEYRLYKNSVTTFSLSDDAQSDGYKITSITFTGKSGYPASGFATQDGWTTDGNDGTWTGEATSVSFTASGAQVRATQIVVTVEIPTPKVLSSIALSGDYPTTFHVGDAFSHEGMTVTANYEGGKTADVTADAAFTGYDMATAGTQTVTVSYTEGEVTKTATYEITVKVPATLTSITLSGTYPTEFQQGDAFSSEGIVVTANYDDDTTADVTEDATFSGYDMSTLGEQTVTVAYNGKTATYDITVVEKKGTEDNPYTVAEAIAYINTLGSSTSAEEVYVSGIISQVDSYNSNYSSITYWISDDGETTTQMEVYSGKGLDNADFSSKDDLQVGDIVTVKGYVKKYNTTPEFTQNNQLVSFERPIVPIISADNVSLEYDATSGEIEYEVANSVAGVSLEATTDAEWISNITVTAEKVTFTTTANDGDTDRTATITLAYTGATAIEITVTQKHFVVDYAKLPFNWEGGASSDFKALNGVTTNGLGSDYAASNAPYRIKFDTTGDYIQIKTDGQPLKVTVDVKMLGGSDKSTIKVQGSADGETFTDVQELTISGSQNTVLNLETTNAFAATDRYVRLTFTKGSNVGIGGITINLVKKSISEAGYATYCSTGALDFLAVEGLTAYKATVTDKNVSFTKVEQVPANEGVLLKGDEGTYTIPVIASATAIENALVGVTTATKVDAGIFVLMNGTSGVGFYKTTKEFTVGANTAYLPATASVRSFIGFDGETTGINNVNVNDNENEKVFDLQGRSVAQPTKGLYIVNGKKVVLK